MRFLVLLLFLNVNGFAAWRLESSTLESGAGGVTHRALVFRNNADVLKAHWVSWDPRHTLRVIDLAPGETVAAGAQKAEAKAAVNGGYFHADRAPLGLVVSRGKTLHRWESSRLLTGVLAVAKNGEARIWRNAEFKRNAPWREALQAGPFLVDRGKPVSGLNATKTAERTVVVADKSGVIALLVTEPITLAALGELLATPDLFLATKIERALNLDGGSSSALWLAGKGSVKSEWKRVRNAVVVVEK